MCAILHVAKCNWLVKVDSSAGAAPKLCTSCTLTRGRPNDADTAALAAFAAAEKAKRRLIVELIDLKLPIVARDQDPAYGLAFDLLSREAQKVVTGHHNGVITLDLAEGDDVHREQPRIAMDEPYRTLLGHFRHEIGHYYFYRFYRRRSPAEPPGPGAAAHREDHRRASQIRFINAIGMQPALRLCNQI